MCCLMGVCHARTMAYHSRSDGRAKVAGHQLFEQLKKLHLERPGCNWLTSMWRSIQAYHDLPSPSGYSPNQILFGRDRIEQGPPWATPGRALDCEGFMANAGEITANVIQALTKEQEKPRHYQKKARVAKYKVGDAVWLDRPSKLSEHRQATHNIPAQVQKQLGEDTDTLKVGERPYQDRHHSNMKPRVPDPRGKNFKFNYAELEVDEDNQFTEEHEYNASKIVGYRPAPDVPGGYGFRTQSERFGQTQDSWEPAAQFVPRYT